MMFIFLLKDAGGLAGVNKYDLPSHAVSQSVNWCFDLLSFCVIPDACPLNHI